MLPTMELIVDKQQHLGGRHNIILINNSLELVTTSTYISGNSKDFFFKTS